MSTAETTAVVAELSSHQRRMWFSEQLAPGNVGYLIQRALRLTGPLDITALRRAVARLVERHESLRTTYRQTGDGVRQVVRDSGPEVFELREPLTLPPGGERDEELRELIERARERRFDLAAGPLLRVELVPLGEQEHLLLLTIHHIAFDGWSMGVFFHELAVCYRAFADGAEPGLDPAPGFLAHLERVAARPKDPAAAEYWRRTLAGAPADSGLPLDFPPGRHSSGRAHLARFELSEPVRQRLAGLGRAHRSTAFITALALYAGMLCRCAGTEEIIVAVPSAGRAAGTEAAGLVGFLVNVVPVRVRCTAETTLDALVDETRQALLDALEHLLPFDRVVALSDVPRQAHRPALAQVGFDLHAPAAVPEFGGPTAVEWPIPPLVTRFEVELHLEHRRDRTTGQLLLSADLFEADAAETLVEELTALADRWTRAPGLALGDLDD
ncbi:condensation domain-containing protein [Streptomyces sp. NPDC048717]|uniref:condensation domain-containing protein n=1 Tax=Streptomyces sp. NPDC048717 TaxID=3154928 RepID=UPI003416DB22